MPTTHDLTDMCNGVDCRKEGTVQPSPTLRYKLWERFGNIRLADGSLDVFQQPEAQMNESVYKNNGRAVPARVGLRYQLKTKNTLQSMNSGSCKYAGHLHPPRDLPPRQRTKSKTVQITYTCLM